MLAFLVQRQLLFRGGLDVGKALDLPLVESVLTSGEIYGAVIQRAYTLETVSPRYPRVAIGDSLLKLRCVWHRDDEGSEP